MTGSRGSGGPSSTYGSARPGKPPPADSVRALPDLAYHFAAAVPLSDARRAIDYSVLAARAATDALAFE